MISCPTCATNNDPFSIICINCKGYLQNKVVNLDLGRMIWKIIEDPISAFREIGLAQNKNFALMLHGFLGIALTFTLMWHLEIGDRFEGLLELLIIGTLLGATAGGIGMLMISTIFHLVTRSLGGRGSIRDSYALIGYSSVPILFSLILVFPIELMTFGMYLFAGNPSPYVIKPTLFLVLAGLDLTLFIWTVVLVILGTKVIHRLSTFKSIAIAFVLLVGLFLLNWSLSPYILRLTVG